MWTLANAILPSLEIWRAAAPFANGLSTRSTCGPALILASVSSIRAFVAGSVTSPAANTTWFVSVDSVLKFLVRRLSAVVDSVPGSENESVKPVPAPALSPPSTNRATSQAARTRNLWRKHQRASLVIARTGYGSGRSGHNLSPPARVVPALEVAQPRAGRPVRRRPPVAARGERPARRHLRPVGQRRALELGEREEALAEHLEPAADLRAVVLEALLLREVRRPRAGLAVAPGVPRHEADLRGPEPVAQRVEQREVVQRVGADLRLRRLQLLARHELGADLGVEDRGERPGHLVLELLGLHHPADQVLDERLGHPAVDVVVAHLVADAVGGPAERELRQVAGPEHDPVALVGDPEQEVRAQPGLDVLEGDVVDLLAARERVADLLEHQLGGRRDVDLLGGDPERIHQLVRVRLGALAGREAGEREAEHVAARAARAIHRLGGDEQRVRRVEPARDADHALGVADRAQPLVQPRDLDVVGLVAIEVEAVDVGGDERVALDLALQAEFRVGRVEREVDAAEFAGLRPVRAPVVIERPHPPPLLEQQI